VYLWKLIPGLGPATANDRTPKYMTVRGSWADDEVAASGGRSQSLVCCQLMPRPAGRHRSAWRMSYGHNRRMVIT